MHEAVRKFIRRIKGRFPQFFKNVRVLEFGSLDINGSVREHFKDCLYLGVDWRAGKGVDHVCLAHEYRSKEKYDVVISTEMLEHDKYYNKSIWNMLDLVRPGGLLIITCAGPNRKVHEKECGIDNFYKNLEVTDLVNPIYISELKEVYIRSTGLDLHMWGIKK